MIDQTERMAVRSSPALKVAGLTCRRGERLLFDSLALEIGPGDALRVSGANGSGKSTLLRVLAGLARPESGSLVWGGSPLHGGDNAPRVAYLGHVNALKDDLSALENLRYASPAQSGIGADDAQRALDWIGLGGQAGLPVRCLSQGQRRRVALARLRLAHARPLWLVDEPFAALDHPSIARVCAMLEEQRARGGMVVYTTHDDTRLTGSRTLSLDDTARTWAGSAC